jgi:dihydropteroate synthase
LIHHGIEKDRIIIDLGIGFAKDVEQSWKLLKNFATIKQDY